MNLSFIKRQSANRVVALVLMLGAALGGVLYLSYSGHGGPATGPNKETSPMSMIEAYTAGKPDVRLTIGMAKSGKTGFYVFGADSERLQPAEYDYEIGSISKTFTASMLSKAISEGRIHLEDPISKYLPLESGVLYPTVRSLATHTSGYGEYPFDSSSLSKKELKAIENDFYEKKLNIYRGINRTVLLEKIKNRKLKNKAYGWEYSNFGMAVLGEVLGEVYGVSFKQLAERFIAELGLTATRLGDGTGDLNHYWKWNEDDAYFAAGGIVSTVRDLLKYGQMHLDDSPAYLALSHQPYQTFRNDGFSMGLGWILDLEQGYIWHNGGTSSSSSFLGIDQAHHSVVVILSNDSTQDADKNEDMLDTLGFTLLDRLRAEDGDPLSP